MQLAVSKDPEAVLFKKLDGFHPCEVSELKSGPHIFAVYGKHCQVFFLIIVIFKHNLLQ